MTLEFPYTKLGYSTTRKAPFNQVWRSLLASFEALLFELPACLPAGEILATPTAVQVLDGTGIAQGYIFTTKIPNNLDYPQSSGTGSVVPRKIKSRLTLLWSSTCTMSS